MLNVSPAYEEAINAAQRRVLPRVPIDLIDPDIVYGALDSSGETVYSYPEQIHDKDFEAPPLCATLELNRWLLDGTFSPYPNDPKAVEGQNGIMLSEQSGEDCSFAHDPFIQLNMSGLSILQAASIYFTGNACDGVAEDLVIEIFSGSTVAYRSTASGNTENAIYWEGFTARDVTAIRVTFLRWSLPFRFPRVVELVPGIYEIWGGDDLAAIDVLQETAFDNLSCPYGVATIVCYNKNQRFNPYNMSGLFQSIEDRQPIPIQYGVETVNGVEYLPVGTYYQQKDGWQNNAYHLTMNFKLVDVVGLVAGRKFVLPNPAPTTLDSWISAILSHLGEAFGDRRIVAADVAGLALQGIPEDLSCGDVLRYACMATCTCFRADAATGYLRVERPSKTDGVYISADDLYDYPTNTTTGAVASLIFRLPDGSDYAVAGTLAASDKTLTISNPFISTAEQAQIVATYILRWYGGVKCTLSGRGDMRCELGDLDTFDTGFGGTSSGRRWKQQFKIERGVMKRVPSYLIGGA